MAILTALSDAGLGARHVALAIGVLLTSVVAHYIHRGYQVRKMFKDLEKQGIPIMKHSWLLGHLEIVGKLLENYPSDAHGNYLPVLILENWRELFPQCTSRPPVLYLDMWPFAQPFLLPLLLPIAVQFTQDHSLIKAHEQKQILYPLTKNKDISSMEGAEWKVWRKRMNPGFSIQTITSRIPDLLDEVEKFYGVLEAKAGRNGEWGEVFQLEKHTTKLAMDIIFRFFFGKHVHAQLASVQAGLEHAVMDTVKRMVFFHHIGNFLQEHNPWRKLRLWRNYQTLLDGFGPVLKQRLGELTTDEKPRAKATDTLVDALIQGVMEDREAGLVNTSDSDFLELAVGQIGTFIFAGHDTTASAICWVVHLLSKHPDVLEKVRAEHDAVLGSNPDDAASVLRSKPELVNALTYTNAVMKEAMRVHTNVGTMRRGEPGFYLTGPAGSGYDGMKFPAGEGWVVWDNTFALHRDPELWPKVHEFIPERFLVTDEEDPMHPPKNGWRFFELGPRNCIGQHLAMVEIKMVLALVLRRMDIEVAWEEWDVKRYVFLFGNKGYVREANKVNENRGLRGKKGPQVWGDRCYHAGADSPPHVKDNMPVHIQLRQ
ncbi:putative cytochrome P450 E-class, group I [Triangularia setosa]|uniref:Cytochrome P450 E-class, group I n=1 Tax=Triangularia setosa TaxID=2587417 RepID=A0AAN7A3V0_9PEZI|nr:putative cytochrome P450 E-class, group I [Podospora setosa]